MQNVVSIKQPEGTYSILYGMHMLTQNPKDIPYNIQAIVLETGAYEWMDDPLACLLKFKEHVQYRALFDRLEKEEIPVVFADVKYKYNDALLLMLDNAFSATEWIVGFSLLKDRKKRTPARMMASAWLMMPFAVNMLRLASAFTGIGVKETADLKKFTHKVHPEADFLYLTLRNAVIAEKEKFLMRNIFGIESHMATVLGAAHVGVEDMLCMSDDERSKFFHSLRPILKNLVKKEQFASAAVLTFKDNKWKTDQMITIPSLHQLVN